MAFDIFLTLFLVLLNGFFVAAEFAIVKVRASQIQTHSGSNFNAKIAALVVNHLDAYLAATQLGITLASLGLGWIGEGVVSEIILKTIHALGFELTEAAAHRIALPVSFALITVLHIVFGELAPKSLAIRYPKTTTLWTASPLRLFYVIFSPFIWLLNGFANFILRMVGVQPVPHAEVHSEEELKLIIAESQEGGAIESSERELIQNVFDFDDRLVRHVLKPRTQIVALDKEFTLDEALQEAVEEGYSRFPVFEENIDNIVGFVTTKDMLTAKHHNKSKTFQDLIRPVIYTSVNQRVLKLLRQFQKERAQLAVVVNEFGGTVGIVTMEDILEELVGEIQDEYDIEQPIVQVISDNKFKVLTQNPIDQINNFLPEPLPEGDEYVTLSGLLLKTSGEMPEVGETIKVGNYSITVTKMFNVSPEEAEMVWEKK